MTMLTIFVLTVYTAIVVYFLRGFKRGLVVHKATLSHFKYGFIPRFTAREYGVLRLRCSRDPVGGEYGRIGQQVFAKWNLEKCCLGLGPRLLVC